MSWKLRVKLGQIFRSRSGTSTAFFSSAVGTLSIASPANATKDNWNLAQIYLFSNNFFYWHAKLMSTATAPNGHAWQCSSFMVMPFESTRGVKCRVPHGTHRDVNGSHCFQFASSFNYRRLRDAHRAEKTPHTLIRTLVRCRRTESRRENGISCGAVEQNLEERTASRHLVCLHNAIRNI